MAKINGEQLVTANGITIAEFLKKQGYPDKMLAIECNGSIVPRKEWKNVVLKEEDTVEVVRFVGGG